MLLAFGAIVMMATTLATTAAAAETPETFEPSGTATAPPGVHLQFPHSGKCITVPRWSTTVGQRLDQYTCVSPSQTNQQWLFHPVPDHSGWYVVQSASSAQCMDVEGHSTNFGAYIVQSRCSYANSAQWFQLQFSGRTTPYTYYLLRNGHSSLCVNVAGASTINGAAIIQWPCNNVYNNEQIRLWRY